MLLNFVLGDVWRRSSRAWRYPFQRLCVAGSVQMLYRRQVVLLQMPYGVLRRLHRAVLGMWVRLHLVLPHLVLHTCPTHLCHQLWHVSEVLGYHGAMRAGANLRDVRLGLQPHPCPSLSQGPWLSSGWPPVNVTNRFTVFASHDVFLPIRNVLGLCALEF